MESHNQSSNLYHQLLQRELNCGRQVNPKYFKSHLFRERYRVARNLYKTDLRGHFGCVNAIEFSHGGKYLASGGDDKRVLIWDVEQAIANLDDPPTRVLETEHTSNIFCLGFDSQNRKVLSGGNDDLVIMHDFESGKLVNAFKHDNPVYGLSIDPQNDSIFATACEGGQILLFDNRVDPADPFVVALLRNSFHAVEFHPAGGNFLVTANSKRGAAFWDIRKPNVPVISYGRVEDSSSCMSVRFNTTGNLILALRRRLPPILYNTHSPEPICTFYHGSYYNSCTMKSCTFAGEDDEFVLSGSDDFNLYVWRVSDVDLERTDQWVESTQMVLYGHRSIVNQVRYNRQKCLLASSGVEKIVKLWSPFAQHGWNGSLVERANGCENPRELYSPYNFTAMSNPPHSWSLLSHDYSNRSTSEDPHMMAFFDSLIQQEIEGWETGSSSVSPIPSNNGSGSYSSTTNESSSSSSDDDDADDGHEVPGTSERNVRRTKRLVATRRKDRKRRQSVLRKVSKQRHKYANRIAYLIATKRNTLRRLAIKGASLNNRGLYNVVKIVRNNSNNKKNSAGVARVMRVAGRKRSSGTSLSALRSVDSPNTAGASTSAAAASASLSGFRSQRRKYKERPLSKKVFMHSDTSSDDVTEPSSRYGGAANSSNMSVPSTSTGITSSRKDIMNLRRQQLHIIDSDEDDDADDGPSSSAAGSQAQTQFVVDATIAPTKKLNGVRRVNDAAIIEGSSSGTSSGPRQSTGVSLLAQQGRTHLGPTISAALNFDGERHQATINSYNSTETSATTTTITTMLPQSNNNHSPSAGASSNRRRPHSAFVDNYSSHSNSRLSNSSCQDDLLDSSASSSNELAAANSRNGLALPQQNQTNLMKRRKLAIAEYINVRSSLQFQDDGIEENNNEQNNNNIFTMNGSASELLVNGDGANNNHNNNSNNGSSNYAHVEILTPLEITPQKSDFYQYQNVYLNNSNNNNINNNNNNNNNNDNGNTNGLDYAYQSNDTSGASTSRYANHLQTPDSGISVATITPITNDDSLTVYGYGYTNNNNNNTTIDTPTQADEHQLQQQTQQNGYNKPVMSVFQKKVARVRRNYRRKFAEEESDESD